MIALGFLMFQSDLPLQYKNNHAQKRESVIIG